MKAAKITWLEMLVLFRLERQFLVLREHLVGRRAEMLGNLQKMGYGEARVPVSDCLSLPCQSAGTPMLIIMKFIEFFRV